MAMSKPTTDHKEIRAWGAVHGATPVEVLAAVLDSAPTKLGFIFSKAPASQPQFKPLDWDQFFALFDVMDLSLVWDDAHPGAYEILRIDGCEQSGFAMGSS